MTRASRPAFALLLLAALAALPLASAQHGPPPGYTDPATYAQDYAAEEVARAQNDTAGYAGGKATPEALSNETEHAAWLACWSLYAYGDDAAAAADPVCAQFFTPPGQVDAPAEAAAEITETIDGTLDDTGADALLGETLDAVNDTVADPLSVLDQLGRVVDAVATFAKGLLAFVVDLVEGVLGVLGLGVGGMAIGTLDALGGLLALLELPVEGLASAAGGVASLVDGTVSGAVLLVDGAVAGVVATADGIAAFAAAVGSGLASAASATGGAVTGTLDAIGDGVGDALDAVGDAVASLLGRGEESPARSEDDGLLDDVSTGTEADSLLDRVLGLV